VGDGAGESERLRKQRYCSENHREHRSEKTRRSWDILMAVQQNEDGVKYKRRSANLRAELTAAKKSSQVCTMLASDLRACPGGERVIRAREAIMRSKLLRGAQRMLVERIAVVITLGQHQRWSRHITHPSAEEKILTFLSRAALSNA
jgi:hypothetical protein